jgi:hypothetical protein
MLSGAKDQFGCVESFGGLIGFMDRECSSHVATSKQTGGAVAFLINGNRLGALELRFFVTSLLSKALFMVEFGYHF